MISFSAEIMMPLAIFRCTSVTVDTIKV